MSGIRTTPIAAHEPFQGTPSPKGDQWHRSTGPTTRKLGDTTFQYRDLNPAQNEIRLLRLLPAANFSIIECEILHISLDNPKDYVAISYAWGDEEDTQVIILDGHEFPVTSSLWHGLNRLRKSVPVIVWADAVCINQQNTEERNHQVQTMTSIYNKAYKVAVWLGLGADNSNMAMELLIEVMDVILQPLKLQSLIHSRNRRPHFQALVLLFDREYWNRLWVVQEITNARDITVYCGPCALPWSTYVMVSQAFRTHRRHLIHAFLDVPTPTEVESSSGASWDAVLGCRGPGGFSSVDRQFYSAGATGLVNALIYHRGKFCSDPRDKVYGILGILSPEQRAQFPVEYSTSTREVYIDVVDYYITSTKRLDILGASIHSTEHRNTFSLPSWVPDWSHHPRLVPLSRQNRRFSAAGATDALFSFSHRRKTLTISAIYIDHIATCGINLGSKIGIPHALMAFLNWRSKIIQTKGYDIPAHEAFCRTLSLDQAIGDNQLWTPSVWMAYVYRIFHSLLKESLPSLPLDENLEAYASGDDDANMSAALREEIISVYILDSVRGRRFGLTSSGQLFLGAGFCSAADVICVPLGCPTPVILRKQRQGYAYIGDVYVDGYMYGKAVEEWEKKDKKLLTFELH
ncbi:hypothetical protein G7Y89_g7230 [Cudoniella acicularis]|uniref:Heterokaryon incompatibility domain-containing protein n=1 Tax=Cudoniella acicularis TaxID=354080 RepID=A0A8H4RL70_9HELO|nr:hypothetical protein G7Y89_g7230 [Cudoniella acicularis]